MARRLRRDLLRPPKLFRKRSGTPRKGFVLHKSCARNSGGCPDDSLRGVCALGPQTFLETSEIPDRGRALCHGLCFSLAGIGRRTILQPSGSLPGSFEGNPLEGLGQLLLGVSV